MSESPAPGTTTISSGSGSRNCTTSCSRSSLFGPLWIILKAETMEELLSVFNIGIVKNFQFAYENNFRWSCSGFPVRSASETIQKDYGSRASLQFFPHHVYFPFQVLFPAAAWQRRTTVRHSHDSQPHVDSPHFFASVILKKKTFCAHKSIWLQNEQQFKDFFFFSEICC